MAQSVMTAPPRVFMTTASLPIMSDLIWFHTSSALPPSVIVILDMSTPASRYSSVTPM